MVEDLKKSNKKIKDDEIDSTKTSASETDSDENDADENDAEESEEVEETGSDSSNSGGLTKADFEESSDSKNDNNSVGNEVSESEVNEKGDGEKGVNENGVGENGVNGNSNGDDKLPFPRATITNLVRKNVSKGKQIKGNVKDEMNLWVNKMVERIAKKINSQPYTFANYEMLKDALAPYEDLQGINSQRKELIKKINLIKSECDSVITNIDAAVKSKKVALKIEQDELPFPKATITNKLRKHLDVKKTIKGPVKRGLNVWLGNLVARISKKMDSYPYPYIDRSMFKEAIEPYEAVGEIELEKERIIQQMQSMKTACDLLVMEINHKFKL